MINGCGAGGGGCEEKRAALAEKIRSGKTKTQTHTLTITQKRI